MEFKGTKGKWVFDSENVFTDDCSSYGNIICESPVEWSESNKNWKANALLISKAPEMLEMLKKLIQPDLDISDLIEAENLIKGATEI
jgi:hypothetical protein